MSAFFLFVNDTATTEIYTLSLHDALPIWASSSTAHPAGSRWWGTGTRTAPTPSGCSTRPRRPGPCATATARGTPTRRSEEHTSELQSRQYLVCRLLLDKKMRPGHGLERCT